MARLFVKVDVEHQKNIGGPVEYLSYYIGSSIQIFNIHVEQLQEHSDINASSSFGVSSFGGIYSLLQNFDLINKNDIKLHKVGVGYEELGGLSEASGNVDTIFACPYVDFGLFGMCIYIYLLYIILFHITFIATSCMKDFL